MNQSLCVLGRQPALGLAELESLFGADTLHPAGRQAVLLDIAAKEISFDRLGGSTRLCQVLATLDTTNWHDIETHLLQALPSQLAALPAGKLQVGLSAIDLPVRLPQLTATGLKLKKVIRSAGRSVRLIPNNSLELNTAQVLHNHLTGPTGCELMLVRDNRQTIIAWTVAVQDITSYTLRDRGRPKRDARVGMLPPKLAQIIINLVKPATKGIILDPFCGTGVLLQEALLMGYGVYGTDLEPRMIEYSQKNLDWLANTYQLKTADYQLEPADATSFVWQKTIGIIATETYLGRPFTTIPQSEILAQTIAECNLIIKKFLKNIGSQVSPGTRFCLAVPAWQIRPASFKHLPLIDQIEDLGYNRVRFEHAADNALLYYRENQIVARELLVLIRK